MDDTSEQMREGGSKMGKGKRYTKREIWNGEIAYSKEAREKLTLNTSAGAVVATLE